jgi:hypothetical protein
MKKYHNSFPCYGQSVVGRVAYWQKMGVAKGIATTIYREANHRGLEKKDWLDLSSKQYESSEIIIPTKKDDWLYGLCPTFNYNGRMGVIDMLHYDGFELQFHIMLYNSDTKQYDNGYWHTVRECMTLEEACTLFEYVEDICTSLIYLKPEEHNKHNKAGALQ